MQEYFSILRIGKTGAKKYLSLKDFKPAMGVCDIVFTKNESRKAVLNQEELSFINQMTDLIKRYKGQLYIEVWRPPIFGHNMIFGTGKSHKTTIQ